MAWRMLSRASARSCSISRRISSRSASVRFRPSSSRISSSAAARISGRERSSSTRASRVGLHHLRHRLHDLGDGVLDLLFQIADLLVVQEAGLGHLQGVLDEAGDLVRVDGVVGVEVPIPVPVVVGLPVGVVLAGFVLVLPILVGLLVRPQLGPALGVLVLGLHALGARSDLRIGRITGRGGEARRREAGDARARASRPDAAAAESQRRWLTPCASPSSAEPPARMRRTRSPS